MKKIIVILILTLTVFAVNAQQDCGVIDCTGRCGRFIDENGDHFCDHGRLSQPAATPPATNEKKSPAAQETAAPTSTKVDSKTSSPTGNNDVTISETVSSEKSDTIARSDSQSNTTATDNTKNIAHNPYPVYHILIGLLILYGISVLLVKKNVWQKATHRKVWNVALTITFLISCMLGVLLAIFIHHGYYPHNYVSFLHIHVWFGIGMTIIAMFHALWHINYFKAMFRKTDSKSNPK